MSFGFLRVFFMVEISCPDCGKKQDNKNKFCRNCGADLSKVEIINENINSNSNLESNFDSNDINISNDEESNSNLSDDDFIHVPILNEDGTNSNELIVSDSNDDLNNNEEKIKEDDIRRCSNCGAELNENEKFCHNCGVNLNDDVNPTQTASNLSEKKTAIVSVILSFLFPGLGQLYNGQSTKGLYFIILSIVSWVLILIIIGAVLYVLVWLWSIVDAYQSAEAINNGEILEDKLF